MFKTPKLTKARAAIALLIALAADALQIPTQLMPPLPEIIDVVAMVLTSLVLGFHMLLLPTFVIEFVPGVDIAPTWTGCVLAVIALRSRSAKAALSDPPGPGQALPPLIPPGESDQGTRPR